MQANNMLLKGKETSGIAILPSTEPNWGYNTQEGLEMMSHMLGAPIMGMKRCIKTSVNYDKGSGVLQGTEKNTALYCNQLAEAFHKYINVDLSSKEGEALIGQHFICQSAPDIWYKLQKLQRGPQTSMA